MTNHDLFAFIWAEQSVSWDKVQAQFDCHHSEIAFRGSELLVFGLIEFDRPSMVFRVRESHHG